MESNDSTVARRSLRDPTLHDRASNSLWARRLCAGGASPVIYRVVGLTRSVWNEIWPRVVSGKPLRVVGTRPANRTDDAVLFFDHPETTAPLGLSFQLVDDHPGGCRIVGDPPALSWRLTAVKLARRLPSSPPSSSPGPRYPTPETDSLFDRRLRLRPDIPCPADTLAPGDDLPEAVRRLRAGFYRIEELLEDTSCSRRRLVPYLATLEAFDLVVDAPVALRSWNNPFAFFGLHWSAHDPLVRRRYQKLSAKIDEAPPVAGIDPARFLDRAYDLLCRREDRRRIRHQLLAPSSIVEVTEFFRRRLQARREELATESAIDAARRILELEPSNRNIRRTLSDLLCRMNSPG